MTHKIKWDRADDERLVIAARRGFTTEGLANELGLSAAAIQNRMSRMHLTLAEIRQSVKRGESVDTILSRTPQYASRPEAAPAAPGAQLELDALLAKLDAPRAITILEDLAYQTEVTNFLLYKLVRAFAGPNDLDPRVESCMQDNVLYSEVPVESVA